MDSAEIPCQQPDLSLSLAMSLTSTPYGATQDTDAVSPALTVPKGLSGRCYSIIRISVGTSYREEFRPNRQSIHARKRYNESVVKYYIPAERDGCGQLTRPFRAERLGKGSGARDYSFLWSIVRYCHFNNHLCFVTFNHLCFVIFFVAVQSSTEFQPRAGCNASFPETLHR